MEFLNKNLQKVPRFKYSELNTEMKEGNSKKTQLNKIVNHEQKFITPVIKIQPPNSNNFEFHLEDINDNINEDMKTKNFASKNTIKQASLLNTISEFGKKIKGFLNKPDAKQDPSTPTEKLSSPRIYQSIVQTKVINTLSLQKATSSSSLAPLSERSLKYDKNNTKPFSRLLVTNVNDVNGSISAFRKSVINLIQDEKERTRLSVVAPHPKEFMSLCTRNLEENLNLNDYKSAPKICKNLIDHEQLDQTYQKPSLQVLNIITPQNEDVPTPIRSNQFNIIELNKDRHRISKSSKPNNKVELINETPKYKSIRTITVELDLNKLNKSSISKRRALKQNQNKNYTSAKCISGNMNLLSSFETASHLGSSSHRDYKKNLFEPVNQGISAENLRRDPL